MRVMEFESERNLTTTRSCTGTIDSPDIAIGGWTGQHRK